MAFKSEFAEILQEKMGNPEIPPTIPSVKKHRKARFAHPVSHFFTTIKTWAPTQIPSSYPQTLRKRTLISKPKLVPIPTSRPPEKVYSLNELPAGALQALSTLKALGAQFHSENITLSAVKKEYRKLAKIYHPDRQHPKADGKIFHQCTLAYRQLSSSVNKML